jgi:hypothetical protein
MTVGLQISLGHFCVLIDKSEAKIFKRPFPLSKKKKMTPPQPKEQIKKKKGEAHGKTLPLGCSSSITEPIPKSSKN